MMNTRLLHLLLAVVLAGCVSVTTDDRDDHTMNHSSAAARADAPHVHDDHADMTMDDMVHGLEGLDGDAFDKAFLEMMIPHHQGAIDMAKLVADHAKHEELVRFAQDIADLQQREIEMMRQWMIDWGYTE